MKRLLVILGFVIIFTGNVFAALVNGNPYISCVTSTSVTITWQSDAATTVNSVNYGLTTGYGADSTGSAGVNNIDTTKWVQSVKINGLAPDTLYHYRANSDAFQSGDYTFTTYPTPSETQIRFIAYGDSRTGIATHRSLVNRMQLESPAPRTVINSGDQTGTSNPTDWTNYYFNITSGMAPGIWFANALGNHEVNNVPLYYQYFTNPPNGDTGSTATHYDPEGYYSYDIGNVRFISIMASDSTGDAYDDGEGGWYCGPDSWIDWGVGSYQYNWIENKLATARTRGMWIVCFHHGPVFSSGNSESYSGTRADPTFDVGDSGVPGVLNWGGMRELYESYDVDLVFSGHDHFYERFNKINGVTYFVTGGGGADIRTTAAYTSDWISGTNSATLSAYKASSSENSTNANHYIVIDINGDSCTTYGRNASGTVFDTFSWARNSERILSGTITSGGSGVGSVNVALTGSASTTTVTNGSGAYSFIVSTATTATYTITPSRASYEFAPISRRVLNPTSNQIDLDFVATATAPISNVVFGFNSLTSIIESGDDDAAPEWEALTLISSAAYLTEGTRALQVNFTTGSYPGMVIPTAVLTNTNLTTAGSLTMDVFNLDASSTELVMVLRNASNQRYSRYLPIAGSTYTQVSINLNTVRSSTWTLSSVLTRVDIYIDGDEAWTLPRTLVMDNICAIVSSGSAGSYSISGTVTSTSSAVMAGVSLVLSGAGSGSTITDASGIFTFNYLADGAYIITPSMAGYSFNPASRNVTVAGANQTAQDFTGSLSTSTIDIANGFEATTGITDNTGTTSSLNTNASYISQGSNSLGIIFTAAGSYPGVNIDGSGLLTTNWSSYDSFAIDVFNPSTMTVSFYIKISTKDSTVEVAPGSTTLTIDLAALKIPLDNVNQVEIFLDAGEFTALPLTMYFDNMRLVTGSLPGYYSISGTINDGGSALSGVTVQLSGPQSKTTQSNVAGIYSFNNLSPGTYDLVPSLNGYTLSPSTRAVTISNANQTAMNFTASVVQVSSSVPVICSFSNMTGITPNEGTETLSIVTSLGVTEGASSLKAVLNNDLTYPGLQVDDSALSITDWSNTYSTLFIDVYNGNSTDILLDILLDNTTGTRYTLTEQTLSPGANPLSVNLDTVRTRWGSNTNIGNMVIYITTETNSTATYPVSLYFDNMRLLSSSVVLNYSISGNVTESSGTAVNGITVTLSGSSSNSAAVNTPGTYTFSNLASNGTYRVTPSKSGYAFSPPYRDFAGLAGNTTQDFVATFMPGKTISGYVKDLAVPPVAISAVTVTLKNSSGTTIDTYSTGATGFYEFENVTTSITYILTPSKAGYSFDPKTFTLYSFISDTTVDFSGLLNTFTGSNSMKLLNNEFNPVKNPGQNVSVVTNQTQSGHVKIEVYDLKGTLLHTLVDEDRAPQVYIDGWDGRDKVSNVVASGIYLIHIEGPGISQTKKVCIIK
ncbi:MAG: hypothetical protein A2252_00720 [Elusimicrobia bacterium RIFOXYA2_FULL_39_19]|nr:MAG: hypothetical protein A2252_00720 [Elusimicrobia bacterium RIFOXYA2_FULL_39_19]